MTDNGTGDYTYNLTNSMSNSTYMFMIDSHNNDNNMRDMQQNTMAINHQVYLQSNTSGGGTTAEDV